MQHPNTGTYPPTPTVEIPARLRAKMRIKGEAIAALEELAQHWSTIYSVDVRVKRNMKASGDAHMRSFSCFLMMGVPIKNGHRYEVASSTGYGGTKASALHSAGLILCSHLFRRLHPNEAPPGAVGPAASEYTHPTPPASERTHPTPPASERTRPTPHDRYSWLKRSVRSPTRPSERAAAADDETFNHTLASGAQLPDFFGPPPLVESTHIEEDDKDNDLDYSSMPSSDSIEALVDGADPALDYRAEIRSLKQEIDRHTTLMESLRTQLQQQEYTVGYLRGKVVLLDETIARIVGPSMVHIPQGLNPFAVPNYPHAPPLPPNPYMHSLFESNPGSTFYPAAPVDFHGAQ